MTTLKAVAGGRIVVALSYVGLAAWVTYSIWTRGPAPAAVARYDLKADHQIEPGDLQTEQTVALVGYYLRRDVGLGKPITPDMVSPRPMPPRIANTMAAIVTLPSTTVEQRQIAEGATVLVTQNGKPLSDAGKVVGLDCNEQACTIVVALPKGAARGIGPDAMRSADIVLVPQPAPTVP